MRYYLAIDLGTTGCRSILFDEQLNILSQAYEEYGLITPAPSWVEQDAELWWTLTKKTAKEAIAKSGIDGRDVDGISISSQGITVVPVDEGFTPLCNAQSWLDLRGVEEAAQIERDYTAAGIFQKTGKYPRPAYSLCKLLWLQKHEPTIWAKAYKFLMPLDFLTAKLCGNPVTDRSMASGTLLYDLENNRWSEEILARYGIDERILPSLAWSGERAGTLLPEVAKELGMREDCVVAVGAQDQKCAAKGAGLEKGTVTVSLGTAGAVTKLWEEYLAADHSQVAWCGYTDEGFWVTEGVISTAGVCLRYIRDLLFPGADYELINEESARAVEKESELLFFPFLSENKGSFQGMHLGTERGEYTAAVMQGVAFEIRRTLEKMGAYGSVDNVVLFGGGSKGALWCQIIADATGMTVKVPNTAEAASAGAAMLAAEGCGVTLPPLPLAKTYYPSPAKRAYYADKYARYQKLLEVL